MSHLPKKVLLTGGGTAGSVMPLIAIAETLEESTDKKIEFVFIGTKDGIEKSIAEEYEFDYQSIIAGKLRRYFDLRNLIDIFKIPIGFVQSLFKLSRFKPEIVLTAGSFVAFPVAIAAYILKIPVIAHQQDIRKSLTNTLISPFAKKVTLTFKESEKDFKKKGVLTGNPLRKDIQKIKRDDAIRYFGIRNDLPVILILGGGTGALTLNQIIKEAQDRLTGLGYIIHITGKGKGLSKKSERYKSFEFLGKDIKYAYSIADVIITRAGISTLTELAFLEKPLVIVPLPETHQEENAAYIAEKKAATVISQRDLDTDGLEAIVKKYLMDPEYKREIGRNLSALFLKNANQKYLEVLRDVIKERYD